MNYFNYQSNAPMGRVWSLFAELGEQSEEEIVKVEDKQNREFTHTLDIVRAAMSGTLPTTNEALENFNLRAYEARCRQNDTLDLAKRAEKTLFIVDNPTNEAETTVKFGDIAENRLPHTEEKAFSEIDNLSSFEASINTLLDIRTEYIEVNGVDLVCVLRNALKGIPEAIDSLTRLVNKDSKLHELVVNLCENGDNNVLLKRLATV